MIRKKFKYFTPIIFLFIAINALFIAARHRLELWHIDQDVIIIGNLILFLITSVSFTMARRGMINKDPNVFFRSVYASIMIKLFACIIAAFIYIAIYKSNLNKPALFICMGLYLVYTFMEVAVLTKLLKLRENE